VLWDWWVVGAHTVIHCWLTHISSLLLFVVVGGGVARCCVLLVVVCCAQPDDKLLLMQVLLKCADICHPARPLRIHKKWSFLIAEEFYAQGDLERQRGMPVSPLCNRHDADLPRSQRGFIDFVCRPSYLPFGRFCNVRLGFRLMAG